MNHVVIRLTGIVVCVFALLAQSVRPGTVSCYPYQVSDSGGDPTYGPGDSCADAAVVATGDVYSVMTAGCTVNNQAIQVSAGAWADSCSFPVPIAASSSADSVGFGIEAMSSTMCSPSYLQWWNCTQNQAYSTGGCTSAC